MKVAQYKLSLKYLIILSSCFIIALNSSELPASAQSLDKLAKDLEGRSGIEPQVKDVLQKMSMFLSNAKQFSFQAEIIDEIVLTGGDLEAGKIARKGTLDVAVKRPSAMKVEYQSEQNSKRFWYDGKTFALWDKATNSFASTAVPQTIKETFVDIMDKFEFAVPLCELIHPNPFAVLLKDVQNGLYQGQHKLNGVSCHKIWLTKEKVDWELWIEDGSRPFPRKVVITYKEEFGAPKYIAALSNWNLKPALSDSSFSTEKPSAAKQVDFLYLSRKMKDY